MITSQFKQFLYSKTMDTALVAAAECAEVGALVDEVYQSFLGHELNNNSGKTKAELSSDGKTYKFLGSQWAELLSSGKTGIFAKKKIQTTPW